MRICFDLDGTLIGCKSRQLTVLLAVARRLRQEFDLERLWQAKRVGRSTRAALSDFGVSVATADSIAEAWELEIEDPKWLALDSAFPDTHEVLARLQAAGHELHLITARRHSHWLHQQLRGLRLREQFAGVHVVAPKDAAAAKATVLQALGPAVFVGDTESDCRAALLAAVPFIALTCGQRSAQFLETHGARRILPSVARLPAHL